MPLLHAHPAGGAALVPLAPLGRQAAAGSWEPGGVVSAASAPETSPRPAPPGAPLTALFVDCAFLRLLGGQRAHGAVLRKLLHVPLPGPHAGAAGDAAGRPGDPLGHGARGAVCNTERTLQPRGHAAGTRATDPASSPKGRNLHGQPAFRGIWATEDGSQRKGHTF